MAVDYNQLSNQELVDLFLKMEVDMVAHVAETLTPERAAYVVSALEIQSPTCEDTSHRIASVFLGLTTKEQVVAVGRVLNTKFTMVLIQELIKRDQSQLWKISSLLIGLTQRVFNKVLTNASSKELEILQHEAMKEPLQHHLTVYVHESEQQINQLINKLLLMQTDIDNLDLENFSYLDLKAHLKLLKQYTEQLEPFLDKLGRALGIAWNTNRPDLIDQLNKIKETAHRTQEMTIGNPRTDKSLPTGTYKLLEEKLCQAFESSDPNETLRDEEPGVEALAALSVWDMKGYWDMGLLPSIPHEEQLKLDFEKHSDKECQEYRENLMQQVNENLKTLNLTTVGDFKQAYLGTQTLLQGYIRNFT